MKNGKKIIRTGSVLGGLLIPFILASCSGGSSSQGSSVGDKNSFSNEPEKVSYALGVNIGGNVADGMKKQGIDSIDPQMVAQGIMDRMKEKQKVLVNKDSTQKIIRSYFKKVRRRKRMANQKKGQEFLKKQRKKEGVKQTKSGLTYKVLKKGSGPKPDRWDSVEVHYKGTKVNGEVFDSSKDRGKPAKFSVQGGVVNGWTEALQMMKEGAEWKIMLPPKLAYGRRGKGQKIGPSETLVFNIQLKNVINVDSAKAAKNRGRRGRRGGGLSPAQKRRLKRQMQKKRQRR